jgi:hypothetical protein
MRLNTTAALGFICAGLLWNAPLGAAVSYPAPPPWQPDPEQREHLRRSLTMLSASAPAARNTVRVLFYGQSITQQAWWKEVERYLRATYPNANLIVENRAIGGHASQLLVKTAEADLYPFQPDLLIFHVYGSHLEYENLIRRVRERTCADILLQTDHVTSDASLTEETDPAKLTPKQWDPWMNHVFLPATASKYGACRADIHELWKVYLKAHNLKAADLLRDGVHLNAQGEWLMAELLKAYLAPLSPKSGYDPFNDHRVRTVPVPVREDLNSLRLEFDGTRADVLFRPNAKGAVSVLVDGKPPSAMPELYGFARVSAFPMSDWPVLLRVGALSPLVAEDWSLKINPDSADGKLCHFTLRGSVTGEDGEGCSTNRFVSKSGRVVIEPADWNVAYSVAVFKRPLPENHTATWRAVFRGADAATPPAASPGTEACVTVAQGLSPGHHLLELRGTGLAGQLEAARFYCPQGEPDGSAGSFGQTLRGLDPPVLLPDGTEFKTWEAPLTFTRTYYVDGSTPTASDDNPGTQEHPFATINRAAKVLAPGERVIVGTGIYRERICPARGGTGPDRMISYEAAPGARVVLKGSRVFHGPWTPADSASPAPLWQAPLKPGYFAGYNPFDIDNVTKRQFDIMDFAAPLRGTAPCNLPRGLVFQDGRRLMQVSTRSDLEGRQGFYWVDRPKQLLLASFFGWVRPDQAAIEITTQETVFAPEQIGLGYIRVKGFIVEQAAGPFPWEQVGAISTTRGHHWIIEDNTVRQVNGVGIDVGIQLHQWPQPPAAGFHIVRRNTVTDCGICGICGLGPGGGREFGLLIEDNVLLRDAFHDTERLFETAGIKTHNNVNCLIRRNVVLDSCHGAGIWMDWDNRNSRCCQNIIVNARTMHGGIFVEASYVPNLIDHNFIWGTQGHGIYEHDCSHQIFAHNFIAQSTRSGLHLHGKITSRRIAPGEPEYGAHQVLNNILYQNSSTNVFGGLPSTISGNLSDGITAVFNRQGLELTWSVTGPVPPCDPVPEAGYDFFGNPRNGQKAVPGPFNQIPAQPFKVKLGGGTLPASVQFSDEKL